MSPETSDTMHGGWSESQIRKLKYAVAVMGVLLVIGFFALLAGLYFKAAKIGVAKQPPAAAQNAPVNAVLPVTVPLDKGSEIVAFALQDGILTIHIKTPRAHELLLIEATSGRQINRFVFAQE